MEHVFLEGRSSEERAELMSRLDPERREEIIQAALPGTVLAPGLTLDEALSEAGGSYRVATRQLLTEDGILVPERIATVREDTGAALGVVSPSYRVHQTATQLAPVADLVSDGRMEISSVRVSRGGACVQIAGILGASTLDLDSGPDVLAHYGIFSASHDGLSSVSGAVRTIRLACLNGMTTTVTARSYNIRHSSRSEDRIQEAARLMLSLREEAEDVATSMQRLASTPMSEDEFRDFAEDLLTSSRGRQAESARAVSRRQGEVDQLLALFSSEENGTYGSSLYDGFNSVTAWIDHQRTRKDRARFSFESIVAGSGATLKADAYRSLMQRVQ